MPAFQVESSIDINASTGAVLAHLHDFERWPAWSPWLYMERSVHLDYRGIAGTVGHGYDWRGTLVGAGAMTLTQLSPSRLEMDLEFVKPFKSHADVRFDIESVSADVTRVTWHMDSKLPFFLFFMTGMMRAMIRSDYDRGLKMLKDQVETGVIHSNTVVDGVVDIPAQTFIGETQAATLSTLAESMGHTYPKLMQTFEQTDIQPSGPPLAIYGAMDLKTGACKYTAGLPVAADVAISDLPQDMETGTIVPGKALRVTHTGSYKHLGNAWSTAMANQRHLKLKLKKTSAPFEVYINDPAKTDEKDLITEIYLPIK